MARLLVATSSQALVTTPAPVTGTPLTMSCWAKLTGGSDRRIMTLENVTDDFNEYTIFADGGNAWYLINSAAGAVGGSFTTGVWHHVAAVSATDSNHILYFDGVAFADNRSATPAGIDTLSIGRKSEFTPQAHFDGALAETAVWNVALSAPQISALAAGASPMSLATLPARHWRFKSDLDFTDLVAGSVITNVGSTWTSDHPPVGEPPPYGRFQNPPAPQARTDS